MRCELNLPIEPRGLGLDVNVADASIEDVPMEGALELGTVVGLNALDGERQLLEHVVDELNRRLLVVARIDTQHSYTGAVVDRSELVVLLAGAADRFDELHVDLQS
jgi:hypothetical protein